jgi:hypothetical protein
MSLFKERTANAKKVIALQNEINSLKSKLNASQTVSCDHSALEQELAESKALIQTLKDQVSQIKSDLKKVRSENTRLKKKVDDQDAVQ